ncbi:MAG: hypothetical protein LW854_14985 [Rubrivivax sp.]|jgi:hypothetical protein|nr:hypothetical protein [Rubrivivax sp.]
MSTPEAQLVWCLRQRREYHSTDGVRWYQVDEPDGDCQRAAETIERLHSEKLELLRWKGIHAPRLVAVEGLLREAQQEAAAGREAIANLASLDSERQANAMLTAEVERLTTEREAIRALLPDELFAGSKDWTQGGPAQRVDCLKGWLSAAKAEASVAYLAFDRVTAERDALRADAERYRWLRDASIPDEQLHVHVDHPAWPNHWALIGEDLDAAVDAARAQTKDERNG